MKKVILIRYGELSTKKGNRNFFVKTLEKNIRHKLRNYNVKIVSDLSHMYIHFEENDLDAIKKVIENTFGISTYNICYTAENNIDSIYNVCLDALKELEFKTFKVETKRSNKKFEYDSPTFSKMLGAQILKNIDCKVDVHNPDVTVNVEIREKNSYVYFNAYKGIGGYPVGCQDKSLLMLSGGIDSPVAGYLAMKRGIKIDCVYFEAIPHTSLDAREKVVSLVKKLVNYTDSINLHIVNFTPIQEEIYKTSNPNYVITIMRRMMYRIMEELCKKNNALAIINGESIGQVASQTLNSMFVINNVTNIPVIRPAACLDKTEIIDISKKIDTYEISILPFEDCCTVFVPKHPIINPALDMCEKMEERFDYKSMIDDAVNNIKTITVTDDFDEFKNLL